MTFLPSSGLTPALRTLMVSSTIVFFVAVGLLLTTAFDALQSFQPPTNPTGGSETASYGTLSAMEHFNLMPGGEVAGIAPEFDAGVSTSYHPQRADLSYASTVPGRTFDERFGIIQRHG